jgi:hypothetical protein
MKRNTLIILMSVVVFFLFTAQDCADSNVSKEIQQQSRGQASLLDNQPVPDLGGYSFERDIVIKTYLARNRTIATYTYTMTEIDAKIIEICASIGYPIPYATQLTNPLRTVYDYRDSAVVGNPEPNGLYTPDSAEGTLVNCVNPDGSVTPTYWEPRVFALPYRIQSDIQLARIGDGESSFSVELKK